MFQSPAALPRLAGLAGLILLTSCGGGGGGGGNAPTPPPPVNVTISGTVTFDAVPFGAALGSGLDFNNIQQRPVRGATLQLLDAASPSTVLASATTDDTGGYSVTVSSNTNVFVRVRAELAQTGTQSFQVRVSDNTQGNALYALDGSNFNSGTANSIRDLNAGSGWNASTNAYSGVRAAAPFAILDAVFDAMALVLAVDPNVQLPLLNIYWSPNNRPSPAINRAIGDIGTTSFFPPPASNPGIYILGLANTDTDEFDRHIIVHEWGHYLEEALSRSDSIGGPHGLDQHLDLRLAFGEGWGNALAAMGTGDVEYRDSFGASQGNDFGFNLEGRAGANPGWFNEESVQEIIYDLFDADADGVDAINLGFGPLYDVLVGPQRTTPALTSLFSFIDALKTARPQDEAAIDALLAAQQIDSIIDAFGSGETNAGNPPNGDVLPIYKTVAIGAPVQVCSDNDFGTVNKLGVRGFVRFMASASGDFEFRATAVDVPPGQTASPTLRFFDQGADGPAEANNTLTRTLVNGTEYVLSVYESLNATSSSSIGRTCFSVSVVQL